jgi:hypothetical protein
VANQTLQAPVAGDREQLTAQRFFRLRRDRHAVGNTNPTEVDTIPLSDGTRQKR